MEKIKLQITSMINSVTAGGLMKDTVVVVYNKERAIAIYSQLASHAWQTVKRRRTLKATFFSFLSLYVCLFSFAETVVSW
jgi:hypothetical protein